MLSSPTVDVRELGSGGRFRRAGLFDGTCWSHECRNVDSRLGLGE